MGSIAPLAPLAASVGMLLVSLMVGTRRGRRSDKAAAAVAVALVFAVLFIPVRSRGADQAAADMQLC